MTFLTCAAVRRRLTAYVDGELPVEEQIEISTHLEGCPPCTYEARDLREVGDALRDGASAAPPPAEAIAAFRSTVLSRLKAENEQSLRSRIGRMFEDMHLVWAGLCGTAATITCAVLLFAIGYFAPPERADSLAGILSALASPGSNRNPVPIDFSMNPPRVVNDVAMPSALSTAFLSDTYVDDGDVVFALAAVVTQEGRLRNPELLLVNPRDRQTVTRLMNAVSEARFEPASFRGAPVAVNLVWLLTHTTVRGKTHS